MARIATDGAEMGDFYFWTYYTGSGLSASTAQKRSGAYSYYFNQSNQHYCYKTLPSTYDELYFRVAIYPVTVFSNPSPFFYWLSGTTILGGLRLGNNPRFLNAYVGGTWVAAGTLPTYLNTWYLIETRVKLADSNGYIQVKIDGIMDINYTGDTKPGSETTMNGFRINPLTNDNLNFGTCYFDDIAVNDISGGSDNSWCGDGRIIFLKPNADGDTTQLMGSDGNQTDNWALVDEIPPSSADYTEGTTSGETDLYNLTASGLSNVNILRVWPEARAIDTVAEGGQIYLPVKTNSVQYDGTAVSLLTSYTKYLTGDVRTVNPQTGSAWTVSELDALQVGAKLV